MFYKCVVAEHFHSPPTEGLGNSETGARRSKGQRGREVDGLTSYQVSDSRQVDISNVKNTSLS